MSAETSAPSTSLRDRLQSIRSRCLLVGGIAALLSPVGAFVAPTQFYRSWVMAFLIVLAMPLGSLGLTMLHHMTGGAWGIAIRRLTEAGIRTLPLIAVFFLPVLAGLFWGDLYPWADPRVVEHDPLLLHKQPYLNPTFFVVRAVGFFALWIGFGFLLLRLAQKHDRTGEAKYLDRMRAVSGPGLAMYGVTMTFASFDWGMSLEPHWFSTIYGMMFVVGQVLTTLCFAILVSAWLARREPFSRFLGVDVFHDLGSLLFAFVMLWAYAELSQFLIIWSGNLAEETPWYLRRTAEGWKGIVLILMALHFFVPFALLMSRKVKRRVRLLAWVAGVVLAMRVVDIYWMIMPAFHEHLTLHWLDLTVTTALVTLWFAYYVSRLQGRPLVSLHDASLQALFDVQDGERGTEVATH